MAVLGQPKLTIQYQFGAAAALFSRQRGSPHDKISNAGLLAFFGLRQLRAALLPLFLRT